MWREGGRGRQGGGREVEGVARVGGGDGEVRMSGSKKSKKIIKKRKKRRGKEKHSLPLLAKLPLNALTCGVILDNTDKLR